MAYSDTARASNALHRTEAINEIIELGIRTARGCRNTTNYQLRMLLIAGGINTSTHTQLGRDRKPHVQQPTSDNTTIHQRKPARSSHNRHFTHYRHTPTSRSNNYITLSPPTELQSLTRIA